MYEPLLRFFKDKSLDVCKPAARSESSGKFVDADDLIHWVWLTPQCCGGEDTFQRRVFECSLHSSARLDHL